MKLSPVLFLIGTEPVLVRLQIEKIRKELFPDGPDGLNDDTFDAQEKNLEEIFDLANTFPMMASKRLIVIKNAEDSSETEETQWLTYFENPSPNTVLIGTGEKLDKRKRLFKALDQKGWITFLSSPKPREMPQWIDLLSSTHGLTVSSSAKALLLEWMGTDLSNLEQEIEKLSLYTYPEKTISKDVVEMLVLKTAGDNIFAFTDQVMEKRNGEALTSLEHLLTTGTPPLVVVAMLARHVRILLKAAFQLKKGTRPDALNSMLGVPPYAAPRYVDQAKKYSLASLQRAFSELADLDRELKSAGIPPRLLVERAVRTLFQA